MIMPETPISLLERLRLRPDATSWQRLEFFVSSMKGMASQFRQGIASPLNVDGKIIGTVHEGDDEGYVVVRTRRKCDRAEMTRVEVMALKRSGTPWEMR